MSDWQPIETAPIGDPETGEAGPVIILGRYGHSAVFGYRNYSHKRRDPSWKMVMGGNLFFKPTHWMPRPDDPPEATK